MLKSIKSDFFLISLFLTIGVITFFGLIISFVLFNLELHNTEKFIIQKNLAISNYIEGYFQKFLVVLNTLSEIDEVKNPNTEEAKQKVLEKFKKIEDFDKDINYIYAGYEDGGLLINGYEPPIGFDPRVRPWYVEAKVNAPSVSKGIPYKEIKTGEWLISMSKAIYFNDKISGVISIDTSLDKINMLINKTDEKFKSLYSYIVKDGIIIFHPNKEFLFKKLSQLIKKDVKFLPPSGKFSYNFQNQAKVAYYRNLPTVGWTVVTIVDKKEILFNIFKNISFSFILVIIVSVILGAWVSSFAGKKIITPLLNLKENVIKITNGELCEKVKYPENEIGVISEEIEKITHTELYKKNLELLKLNKRLKEMSIRDKLTSLYNRHKMDEELKKRIMIGNVMEICFPF
ncbi:HAMP domain-containing protein [Thermosipho melanesiensis]|uniref:Chemotaxis protein n=2 Tax=Thermosipho melanesiensis TaxID=46541 RepID=A0ABM6LBR7_9BACT|nr:cache domain-containing protein [Thermosipho melanesiensis]ABR30682.1 putative diguanylate cyclase [Thermosipho melanesiensis BI429]APT73814.1 chemotaxis protein [Thermosipho melanesiensis]